MEKIRIINDYNLSAEEIKKLPISKKARGVVFLDHNTIVCVEEKSHDIDNLLILPGGTIENGEDEIQAFAREVKEEIGYEIDNIIFLGIIELIRKKYMSVTYCYTAKTKGPKEDSNITAEEIVVGTRSLEINLDEALNRINKEHDKNPNDTSLRSMLILKEVKL